MSGEGRALMRLLSTGSMLELRMIRARPAVSGRFLDSSVSYKDVLYLDMISEIPDCTVSRLAELASVTKPTVTVRVNGLVEKGLVVKERSSEDGRVTFLRLSEEMERAYEWEEEVLQEILDAMDEDERRAAGELFDRISERMMRSGELLNPERLSSAVDSRWTGSL